MKIVEGKFSPTPAQPHTGLLGILIRHREAIEPNNKIMGNAAGQMLALARAIIEGLGGKLVDGQWEVEIGGTSTIHLVSDQLAEMTEQVAAYLEKIEAQSRAFEERLERLETPVHGELITMEGIEDPRIAVLEQRNADLEKVVEDLAAAVAKLEAAQADVTETPAKPGRKRKFDSLPPIGTQAIDKN